MVSSLSYTNHQKNYSMKTKKLLFGLFASLLFLGGNSLSAQVTCDAQFTATVSPSGFVSFTPSTTGSGTLISTHSWDFGDGSSSNNQGPVHTYNSAGAYQVCHIVTVQDSNQSVVCMDTVCDSIYVANTLSCIADFSSTASGLAVNFSDLSSANATRWDWTFGDGVGYSGVQNPTYTYSAPGTYNVMLIIYSSTTLGFCTDTLTKTITVTNPIPCNAIFYALGDSLNPTAGGFSISFNDVSAGSPTSWYWDFGDGNVDSTQNPNHSFSAVGWYYVCLTISNATCTSTICDSIYIDSNFTVQAIFSYQQTGGNGVQFTNGSTQRANMSYYWDFGDGTTSTQMSPSHTYTTGGNYTVCLTAVDNATNIADITCISNVDPSAVVSLQENNSSTIKLYPNPVHDVLTIDAQNVSSVKVYSTTGVLVLDTESTTIDMSEYDNGLYIIQIQFNNQTISTKRVIKTQ